MFETRIKFDKNQAIYMLKFLKTKFTPSNTPEYLKLNLATNHKT